jgi:hypothetical protein
MTLGLFTLLVAGSFIFSGCATPFPMGNIYTDITMPSAVGTGNLAYSKVGKSQSKSILGLVATGDASIATAAQNGGITQIKYVDYKAENILGIIGTYTTTVYGD